MIRNIAKNFIIRDHNKSVSKMFNTANIYGVKKRMLVLIDSCKKIVFEKTHFSLFYPGTNRIIEDINK